MMRPAHVALFLLASTLAAATDPLELACKSWDIKFSEFLKLSTTVAAHSSHHDRVILDMGDLLDAGEGALVTLVAGESQLTAHRAVLAARCAFFADMFCDGAQEANSSQVTIQDVEDPVLRQVLAYIYTLQAPQLPDLALPLVAAADKFTLLDLKAECEEQALEQLTVENAAATAVLAIRHSSVLRMATIPFIGAHREQVLATKGWADAMRNHPEEVSEVYRRLEKLPVETSPRRAVLSSTPAAPDCQPTAEGVSQCHEETPAAAASPSPTCHDVDVFCLQRLSPAERGKKLIQAAEEGRADEVAALLAAGADVGARSGANRTALHYAASRGDVEMARQLVMAGADVNARDMIQQVPLHEAAWRGRAAVARLLLAASADPNARKRDGMTALHEAAVWGNAEVAAALLEAGADTRIRDNLERTPLGAARQEDQEQVIQLLTRT